jgi:hypothetical protein
VRACAGIREAREARAEAYIQDQNYDDAVTDLRAALEAGAGESVQEKLEHAQVSCRLLVSIYLRLRSFPVIRIIHWQ